MPTQCEEPLVLYHKRKHYTYYLRILSIKQNKKTVMKKTFTLMAAAVLLLATFSCKKEGVYNPGEKIKEVYTESTTTTIADGTTNTSVVDKYKSQQWTWDGKLLTEITNYTPDGTAASKMLLTYDGKKLARVSNEGSDIYTEYTYKSNKLTAITVVSDGNEMLKIDVIHDDGKISRLKFIIDADLSNMDLPDLDFAKKSTSFAIPEFVTDMVFKSYRKHGKGSQGIQVTLNLTYESNNVSKISISVSGITYMSVTMSYDKKNNPMYGCYAFIGPSALSKNNITNVKAGNMASLMSGEADIEDVVYVYTYTSNDYPETVTTTSTQELAGEDGSETNGSETVKETTTYVYE